MTIKDLILTKLCDDYTQIEVIFGNVNDPTRIYTGYLCEISKALQEIKIDFIAPMGEERRREWNLNKNGWMEIWVDDEEAIQNRNIWD